MEYNGYIIDKGKLILGNLNVRSGLDLGWCTSLTSLPANLSVGTLLDLDWCTSLNYPIVHECGETKRSIWLDYKNKKKIHIGCFCGTRLQAIKAIKIKYNGDARDAYIEKVNQCFDMASL